MNCLCIGLLCLLPQDSGVPGPQNRTVPVEDLVMEFYTPAHMDPMDLKVIVERMAGSNFTTKDKDAIVRAVDSLQVFDNSILVYETQERATKLIGMLENLDRVALDEYTVREDLRELRKLESTESRGAPQPYRPKFLSLMDLREALQSYSNRYPAGFDFVESSGFLIVKLSPPVATEVFTLLERVDVASPQLIVTSYLVRGQDAAGGQPAPADLADGLAELLGFKHVTVEAQGLLRVSADAHELAMRLDVDEDRCYELRMKPKAFSSKQKAWSVEECRLDRLAGRKKADSFSENFIVERVFSTETVIYTGEYTVLGATGSEPELVVIRVEQANPASAR